MGLATWRISHMLALEEGPFRVFVGFRKVFGVVHDDAGNVTSFPDGFGRLVTCMWCLSTWVAVIIWLIFQVAPIAVAVMAIAAVAMVVEVGIRGHSKD